VGGHVSGGKDEDLVTLTEAGSVAEAEVVCGLLSSCGVQAHVARGRGVARPDSFDLLPVPLHPFEHKSPVVRVLVLSRDLERAKEILAGEEQSPPGGQSPGS